MGIMYMPAVTGRHSLNTSVALQRLFRNLKTSPRDFRLKDAVNEAVHI